MKKQITALSMAAPLMAGITFGVDTGKYSIEGLDLKATKIKAGYAVEGIGVYGYYQRDKIDFISGDSYGGGR